MISLKKISETFGAERTNQKIRIRPFGLHDLDAMRTAFYNKVLDYMELVLEPSTDNARDYAQYLEKQKEKTISFSCFDLSDGSFTGITQLKYIDSFNKKCEMGGTWFGKKFQGKGFNQASKQLLFAFVFEDLGFRRLQFSVDVDNTMSVNALMKMGAKQEGLFRNNWVDKDGKSRDDFYFSITDSDWEQLKTTTFSAFYK